MKIKESHSTQYETDFQEFYNKSSKAIPNLKKFAVSKLKLAEKEGLIDKGFYDANEILDEVFTEVFKTYTHESDKKIFPSFNPYPSHNSRILSLKPKATPPVKCTGNF